MTNAPKSSGFSLENLQKLKILVVGDIMLDTYMYGDVSRISPEAPVPVLSVTHETKMLGGCGNVLSNLAGLGVKTFVASAIGSDAAGEEIENLCARLEGCSSGFVVTQERPTIQKTRLVGNNQQMLRTDREEITSLSAVQEQSLLASIEAEIKQADAVILSDYGKGVLTPAVLKQVIAQANVLKIPVLIDPKGHDYSRYAGADVVTPNRKELAEACGNAFTKTDAEIEKVATGLIAQSGVKAVIATRSADGMSVIQKTGATHLKTIAREVYDVSGAGDTVIAVLATALACKLSLIEAASLANKAAGIVVGRAGTSSITIDDMFEAETDKAWLDCSDAKTVIEKWQAQGLKVGFTNGCFDILHAGHVTYLKQASSHCDRLILGLNHDNSVRILKGPTRPVNNENDRATVMAGLASIDLVILFGAEKAGEDNTPGEVIGYLKPNIIFKGGDYTEDQLPEAKIARSYGGDVKIMGIVEGKSTTNIINKINAA